MEYHGKFGYTLGQIQHISLMSRIDICCTACLMATQTVSPTIPGLQFLNCCIQYMSSHPHKPIFDPSHYYDGWKFIRFTCSGNQVECYTTQNFIIPSRWGLWYNYQQKTVSFRYYSYSPWRFCLLKIVDSTSCGLWIHWWIHLRHVEGCQKK